MPYGLTDWQSLKDSATQLFIKYKSGAFDLIINFDWGAKYAKCVLLDAFLGEPNMVKWGIPEMILQNAVQTHWACVNKTPSQIIVVLGLPTEHTI